MTLEGFPQFEEIRDFLYERMRGSQGRAAKPKRVGGPVPVGDAATGELAGALRETAAELRAIRQALERRTTPDA